MKESVWKGNMWRGRDRSGEEVGGMYTEDKEKMWREAGVEIRVRVGKVWR